MHNVIKRYPMMNIYGREFYFILSTRGELDSFKSHRCFQRGSITNILCTHTSYECNNIYTGCNADKMQVVCR